MREMGECKGKNGRGESYTRDLDWDVGGETRIA